MKRSDGHLRPVALKEVDGLPHRTRNGKIPKRHGIRYPWTDWFAQGTFTLRRGRDFQGMPHGMAQTVRQAAIRLGLEIRLRVNNDHLLIEVL